MLWRRRRNSGSYPYLARLGIGVFSAPEPVRRGDYKAKLVPLLRSDFENDHCCGEGSSSFLPLKKRAGIVQGKHHLALHVLLDVHTEAGGAGMEEHHDHDDLQRGVHRDDGGSWGEQHVWDRGQCFYGCSGYLPCCRHKVLTLENVTCLHLINCSPSPAGSSPCSMSRTRCTWRTGSRARQVRLLSFSLSFLYFSSDCCPFHYHFFFIISVETGAFSILSLIFSGKTGVCIAQNGPGITNFVTGVAAAFWAHRCRQT